MKSGVQTLIVVGACFLLLSGIAPGTTFAKTVEYHLTIARQKIQIENKSAMGMTINGTIPGPVLRFKEGDTALIHVHNAMNVSTSLHWHGMLVPNAMDGVPYLTYPPIQPGATFTYTFPIRQSGTYWYHSHSNLQEQSGVYGAIVIKPVKESIVADQEKTVVLSDWTTENPYTVIRTLKRGSDWYSLQKGSAQSLFGAMRAGMTGDYFKRELLRMPPMDISDNAYDYFLANGKPEIFIPAKPGETLRLRFVDGSAMTYFYLEFAGGPMRIVAADGQDVEPLQEKRFLMTVAETYDVLVTVPPEGAYELRATAEDGSGYASIWIGSGRHHPAPAVPQPNTYSMMGKLSFKRIFALTPAGTMGMGNDKVEAGMFDKPGMMGGMGMMKAMSTMKGMVGMHHSLPAHGHQGMSMKMPMAPATHATVPERSGKRFTDNFIPLAADVSRSKDLAVDGMDPRRPWPPYAQLRSVRRTAFSKKRPVRVIRLTLDGDMERYVWFLNNKPLSASDSIRIRKGEVVRFVMINRTMMHHPMHLHGHFFRVINGQKDRAPLKHTVDVAPMSTTVIEFKADEMGDWFFHCHFLYHLNSGMARVVHYEGFTLYPALARVRPKLYHDQWYPWLEADILSNMTQGFATAANTYNSVTAQWEVGWQDVDETDWETLFTYDRYINRFLSLLAGGDFLGTGSEPFETGRGVIGLHYLLPLNIESRIWADTDGGARFNLAKTFKLTPRLALLGETEYDTHELWKGRAGLSYLLAKSASLILQWHSDYGWGGGMQLRF